MFREKCRSRLLICKTIISILCMRATLILTLIPIWLSISYASQPPDQKQAIVDLGSVAADGARFFKRKDATRRGRGRKTDRLADFVVGGAAVAGKVAKDGGVKIVEAGGGAGSVVDFVCRWGLFG